MDMSSPGYNNLFTKDASISGAPKDIDFVAFEKMHTGKDTNALTVTLKGLQSELETHKKNTQDIDINSLDLESDTFAMEAEGLHEEAMLEAKIKIIEKLLDAEKKYTIQ